MTETKLAHQNNIELIIDIQNRIEYLKARLDYESPHTIEAHNMTISSAQRRLAALFDLMLTHKLAAPPKPG